MNPFRKIAVTNYQLELFDDNSQHEVRYEAFFHRWITKPIQLNGKTVEHTMALIELADGTMGTEEIYNIIFLDEPEKYTVTNALLPLVARCLSREDISDSELGSEIRETLKNLVFERVPNRMPTPSYV